MGGVGRGGCLLCKGLISPGKIYLHHSHCTKLLQVSTPWGRDRTCPQHEGWWRWEPKSCGSLALYTSTLVGANRLCWKTGAMHTTCPRLDGQSLVTGGSRPKMSALTHEQAARVPSESAGAEAPAEIKALHTPTCPPAPLVQATPPSLLAVTAERDNGAARPDPGRSRGTLCRRAHPSIALILLRDGSLQKPGGVCPNPAQCWGILVVCLAAFPPRCARRASSPGPESLGSRWRGREEPEDGALPSLFLQELLILED